MKTRWQQFANTAFYDELITANGRPRAVARRLINLLNRLTPTELRSRREAVELAIKDMGISFTVYDEGSNIDRAWPMDIIPRLIRAEEWRQVREGLSQRTRALNAFIDDVYGAQKIFADDVVPSDIVLNSRNFKEACIGAKPQHGVWANICGTDLVRDVDGKFYVLEDNLRVPSGVSYMIENREVTKRVWPELFQKHNIQPIDDYPSKLYSMLASISPRQKKRPCVVVLTPGIFNSAYFEHAFLARAMGAELVEGSDLYVGRDECVFMRTVGGSQKVDVIYRRIDDDFIDPEVFRPDSTLGVPGLMRAWRAGKVAIANAPGSGVADDKVVYAYVDKMIDYYLGEQPQVSSVKTYLCNDPEDREFVLDNIASLVIKPANESGGYGLMVGPHASTQQHSKFAKLIQKNPRNYIAQPTLAISTAPTLCGEDDDTIAPRHLDLRPFILQGKDTWVTRGGLTRVALREGSLVVNSSQGGGSKDTWIVED